MSESTEAWGVYRGEELLGLDYTRSDAEITAECENDFDGPVCQIVAMIPAPDVERRIAEAVAEATRQLDFLMSEARNAERERCKMIAERIKLAPLWDFGTAQAIWDEIESGEQPTTEGGA